MFRKIKGCVVKKNLSLKNISTFKIGGNAKYFLICSNLVALKKVIKICINHNLKFKVVGGCSNLLFDDRGFCGAIIKLNFNHIKFDQNFLTASGDNAMSKLISITKQHDLSGLEYFVGIPCCLGGAIFNNLGTNKKEISELIDTITILKIKIKNRKNTRKIKSLKIEKNNTYNKSIKSTKNKNKILNKKLIKFTKTTIKSTNNHFSYRKNNFLKNFDIILFAKLKLINSDKNIIQNNLIDFLNLKTNSQPLNMPSAGSIFKRGKDFFPAQIIDELGLKGVQIGGAKISKKHAGFIVNTGNAKCQDVLTLIEYIRHKVWTNCLINLDEEIEYVPYK